MKVIYVCVCCSIVYGCTVDGNDPRLCHVNCDRKCTEDGVADIEQAVCPSCIESGDWRI